MCMRKAHTLTLTHTHSCSHSHTHTHSHSQAKRRGPVSTRTGGGVTPKAFPLTAGGGSDESEKLSNFPLF